MWEKSLFFMFAGFWASVGALVVGVILLFMVTIFSVAFNKIQDLRGKKGMNK